MLNTRRHRALVAVGAVAPLGVLALVVGYSSSSMAAYGSKATPPAAGNPQPAEGNFSGESGEPVIVYPEGPALTFGPDGTPVIGPDGKPLLSGPVPQFLGQNQELRILGPGGAPVLREDGEPMTVSVADLQSGARDAELEAIFAQLWVEEVTRSNNPATGEEIIGTTLRPRPGVRPVDGGYRLATERPQRHTAP